MRRSGEVLVRRRILVSAARAFLVVSVAIGLSVALGGAAGASRTRFHHGNGSDGRNGVEGTVSSAPSSDSFPITTRSGSSLTVDVTSSTIYLERGVTSPSLTNVAEGDVVAVFGTTSGTTVTATQVVIFLPGTKNVTPRRLTPPGVEGTVSSAPSSDSFPITTRSGSSLTVDVTSSTIYLERGVTSPSLTNVAEGDVVAVFGTTSGTTVTATQVVISSGQGRGRVGFGRSSRRGHGPEGRSGFGPAGAPGGFGPQQGPR